VNFGLLAKSRVHKNRAGSVVAVGVILAVIVKAVFHAPGTAVALRQSQFVLFPGKISTGQDQTRKDQRVATAKGRAATLADLKKIDGLWQRGTLDWGGFLAAVGDGVLANRWKPAVPLIQQSLDAVAAVCH
jgi:hypothetical protein